MKLLYKMGLGQKLEEARNRKGISIREATESTKIRSDYLSSFESGDFNINLPVVYLRGFVRLYSRFLGLDQEGIMTDLDVELGSINSKNQRKSLGSIASNDQTEKKVSAVTSSSTNKSSKGIPVPKLIFSALGLALFLVVALIINAALSEDDLDETALNEPQQIVEKIQPLSVPAANAVLNNVNSLNLAAVGPIDRLIICDEGEIPKKYHEFNTLPKGWEITIQFKNSFKCYSSSLESLRFAVDDGLEKKAQGVGAGNFSWSAE